MGYTKNSWQSGDIITKTKLDNMEDGIAGAYEYLMFARAINSAGGSVSANDTTITLDLVDTDGQAVTLEAGPVYALCLAGFTIPSGLIMKSFGADETGGVIVVDKTGGDVSYNAEAFELQLNIFKITATGGDDDDGR